MLVILNKIVYTSNMRTPYTDTYSEAAVFSSLETISQAQGLTKETTIALKLVIQTMNNPEDPCTIDEAIEYALLYNKLADSQALYSAYEALFLFHEAKRNLASTLQDGDTRAILHMLESFGKIEGYKNIKEEKEAHEVIITIEKQY